jgi:hypothetical protein
MKLVPDCSSISAKICTFGRLNTIVKVALNALSDFINFLLTVGVTGTRQVSA